MNIRNHHVSVRNHRLSFRNHCVGICNYHICVNCQLWLKEVSSREVTNSITRTHIKDVKNPDKVLLPTGNLVLVTLREDKSGDCISLTLPDDLTLDLGHGSAIRISMDHQAHTICPAHVVRSPIAPRTHWLSPSNPLPFNLR